MLILSVLLVLSLAVVTAHYLMLDRSAKLVRASGLIPAGSPARVLVVLAHPGDEVSLAGTVKLLGDSGVEVEMLALTAGEQRPPQLAGFAAKRLGGVRADEFARAAQALGATADKPLKWADGSLSGADPKAVLADISEAIAQFRPSALLTTSEVEGADPDISAAATLAVAAAREQGSTVARVWQVTRAPREVAWLNRAVGPVLDEAGRVNADVSVRISDAGGAKVAALLAHGTQSPDLGRSLPMADAIPAAAYFRFFDREYFHLLWGQPLP